MQEPKIELFFFSAEWCGPCKNMKMIVPNVLSSIKNKNITLKIIDVDKNNEIAQKYNVRSLPTFVLVKENANNMFHEISRIIGFHEESVFKKWIIENI